MGPAIGEIMERSDALLYGRRTWQGMAAAWPGRAGDPFADQMNAIKKYVASRTLSQDDLTWDNSELLEGDALAAVRELKARDGGALQMWGSASFARQLIENDLVDEYVFLIEPLWSAAARVFPEDGAQAPARADRRQAGRHRHAGHALPPGAANHLNPS